MGSCGAEGSAGRQGADPVAEFEQFALHSAVAQLGSPSPSVDAVTPASIDGRPVTSVVVPAPTGDDADRLFDALLLLSAVSEFSEIKTSRSPM
jgi:hypothetical protein